MRVQPALCLGLVVDFNLAVLLRMAGVERAPPTGWVILHRLRNPVARGAQSSETQGKPTAHPSCAVGPVPARSFGPSLRAAEQQSPGLAATHATADAAGCEATNPPPGNRTARSCTLRRNALPARVEIRPNPCYKSAPTLARTRHRIATLEDLRRHDER
jgi:hypothetical protein